MISNHGQMEQLLTDAGLCSVFGPSARVATVLDSHVVGFGKPDRRIFELALAALDTSPSQCLHVGDSVPVDVAGAQAAGITPVHVDPYRLCASAGHAHPTSLATFTEELLG